MFEYLGIYSVATQLDELANTRAVCRFVLTLSSIPKGYCNLNQNYYNFFNALFKLRCSSVLQSACLCSLPGSSKAFSRYRLVPYHSICVIHSFFNPAGGIYLLSIMSQQLELRSYQNTIVKSLFESTVT